VYVFANKCDMSLFRRKLTVFVDTLCRWQDGKARDDDVHAEFADQRTRYSHSCCTLLSSVTRHLYAADARHLSQHNVQGSTDKSRHSGQESRQLGYAQASCNLHTLPNNQSNDQSIIYFRTSQIKMKRKQTLKTKMFQSLERLKNNTGPKYNVCRSTCNTGVQRVHCY